MYKFGQFVSHEQSQKWQCLNGHNFSTVDRFRKKSILKIQERVLESYQI